MDSNNKKIKEEVFDALEAIIDPELSLSIVKLGLVRDVVAYPSGEDEDASVEVIMTLTSPMCPFADAIISDVEDAVTLLGYGAGSVTLTFDPPWEATPELRMMMGL